MLTKNKIKLRLKQPVQPVPTCLFNLLDVYLLDEVISYLLPVDIINFSKCYPHQFLRNRSDHIQQIWKTHPEYCEICLKRDGKIAKWLDLRLCDECCELPSYKLICKTTIKKQYCLTDKEITKLNTYSVRNPYYRHAPEMILVRLYDVYEYLCQKHNCNVAQLTVILDSIHQNREKRKHTMSLKREESKNNRKILLEKALNEYQLVIRDDSKLCHGYIDGTIKDWTIPQIVNRMCQMRYLYDYCNFDEIYEKVWRNIREYEHYVDSQEVFDTAEHKVLKTCGGYPSVFPWMLK